jgi:Zn-dependent protease
MDGMALASALYRKSTPRVGTARGSFVKVMGMLRFRLGTIPVEVHPSHLLLIALLSASWSRTVPSPVFLLALMAAMSFSVLFHELGHALVAKAFGYHPGIQLAGLGGNTRPNSPGPIPWHRDVLLTLAGPVFGLLLAGACFLGLRAQVLGAPASAFLARVCELNVVWSVLNLIPVLPMDGGRIAYAILTRLFAARGARYAWGASCAVASALAIWAAAQGSGFLYLAMLFGVFAFQAGRAFLALREGESAANDPPDLVAARAAFTEGDLAEARRRAARVAEQNPSPALRSRAEHLLGWVALKEGEGRRALDHFSLVSRQRVEREALAAAFSLVGDDVRALPLWELAYRESPNSTLLHEWAATLLRLGQEEALQRLPGVDPAVAHGFAERVYFLRGQYKEAADEGSKAFGLAPSAARAYDLACASAKAGLPDGALHWLDEAARLGFSDVQKAERDPDLASLHALTGFDAWRRRLGVKSTAS